MKKFLLLGLVLGLISQSASAWTSTGLQIWDTLAQFDEALYVGQRYGGGIIFWIDDTGQHGLIAAAGDQGYIRWGSAAYVPTGASIHLRSTSCANYRGGDYADWFLPAKDEIFLLYQQKNAVGGFVRGSYWSSSEFDHALAWTKFFYNDRAVYSHKDRFDGVRAIRAF